METVTKTGSFISMFALSEHLVEFRKRLLAVVICFFLVFCVSLLFADQIYQYVTQSFQQKLIVLGPNDILWIYIRLASLMAFTITLPYTVYHIWSFIKPGLKKEEARAVFVYIPASFLCFLVGLAFGFYFITPALLQVLLGLGEGLFETQLTAQNYLSFVFQTTLPLALIFELPVIIAFFDVDWTHWTRIIDCLSQTCLFYLIGTCSHLDTS